VDALQDLVVVDRLTVGVEEANPRPWSPAGDPPRQRS
jgi:hypothetical protein